MPTWNEVKDYARSNYTLSREYEMSFSLVYEYSDGRSQLIICECGDLEAEDTWLRFRSPVCPFDALDPIEALKMGHDALVGAFTLHEDHYHLVHKSPLSHLDPEELDKIMGELAMAAEQFGETYDPEDLS